MPLRWQLYSPQLSGPSHCGQAPKSDATQSTGAPYRLPLPDLHEDLNMGWSEQRSGREVVRDSRDGSFSRHTPGRGAYRPPSALKNSRDGGSGRPTSPLSSHRHVHISNTGAGDAHAGHREASHTGSRPSRLSGAGEAAHPRWSRTGSGSGGRHSGTGGRPSATGSSRPTSALRPKMDQSAAAAPSSAPLQMLYGVRAATHGAVCASVQTSEIVLCGARTYLEMSWHS